jgi:isoflavone/4'-methoxyisoflavone 2'-hydroxylase
MNFISANTFLCLFLLIFAKILLNSINKSKKNLPPGPPALPILGHLHLVKQPLHQWLHKISNQYGPAVFLHLGSRPVLVISSQPLAEKCFTTHDLTFSNRVHLPTVQMAPNLIVWANYGPYWRTVRQTAAFELLSSQKLNASSHIRTTEYRGMVHKLFISYESQEKSEESNSFLKLGFKKMLFDLMMNIMLVTIAGKSNDDSDDMKEFREALLGWFKISGASNAEDFLPLLRILDLKGTMKRMKNVCTVNEVIVQRMIDEHRREGVDKGKTMINHLLELQKKDYEKYKDEVIRDIVIVCVRSQ